MRSVWRFPAVILGAIAALLLLPSLLWGPGATDSGVYNYLWTSHFGREMAQGQLYERWLPDSFEGLGSPAFYFYPPIAYWLSGGLNAMGLSVFQAINVAAILMLAASGLAMHAWLSGRSARPMLGAALYMIAPYHLYDFHVRGALAEFAAFVWLPLIALGITRLPGRRGVVLLTLSYAGLVLTHMPTALLAGLFLILPLMVRRIMQDRAALPTGAVAGLLALGLAAFYLLPALTLQGHISTQLLWNARFSATAWSIWREDALVFCAIALGAILLAWPARSIWTGIAVVTGLASVGLIPFLWEIDLLNRVQFPWRVLAIAEFATVTALMHYRPRPVPLAIALMPLALAYVILLGVGQAMLRLPVDQARIERVRPDAPEYLPRGIDSAIVNSFDRIADLSALRALPRGDRLLVRQSGRVTIGHAAFPIWRVTRDGRDVATHGPLLSFEATPGVYRVERVTIWQERVGWAISMACALLLAAIAVHRRDRHVEGNRCGGWVLASAMVATRASR